LLALFIYPINFLLFLFLLLIPGKKVELTSETSNSKKKIIIIVTVGLFVLLLTIAGWIMFSKSKKTSNTFDFPNYPNAIYVGGEYIPACDQEQLRRACGGTDHTWETKDPFETVLKWYEGGSNSKWKLTGGGGDGQSERYGWFTNGKQEYWLSLSLSGPYDEPNMKTRITIFIPDKAK
jgi:hypothetical protein